MSHLQSHLRSAEAILCLYNGEIPFAAWLKDYFRQYKKFGSRDRKTVADLCFCFYRLSASFQENRIEERLLIGQLLCHTDSAFVTALRPEWVALQESPAPEKAATLDGGEVPAFFPSMTEVSDVIETKDFNLSMLIQPDVFLRARPKKLSVILQKLSAAGVAYSVNGDCIAVAAGRRIDDVIEIDNEAVVQDKSSQQVLNALEDRLPNTSFSAWDCCAASGGKSILLRDLFPSVQLTVSDIRESIIHNLRSRFKRAGITAYQSFVADIGSPEYAQPKTFDLIVCDAPCSGSGTWCRTPEQLHFFQPQKIAHYADLQKRIASNATKSLKPGGHLLYITCSVFKKENEDVVEALMNESGLKLVSQQYHIGYHQKADTLFSALLQL